MTYETDFTLTQDWVDLAETLELYDKRGGDDDSAPRRAYMLWLWMQSLYN